MDKRSDNILTIVNARKLWNDVHTNAANPNRICPMFLLYPVEGSFDMRDANVPGAYGFVTSVRRYIKQNQAEPWEQEG